VWLRLLLTLSFVAAAAAGLTLGMSDADEPVDQQTGWFAKQIGQVERDTLRHLALGQAATALDARARMVLHGEEERSAAVPFVRYSLQLPASAEPAPEDLVAGVFETSAILRYTLPVDRVVVGRAVDATFEYSRRGWRLTDLGRDGSDLWEHETVDVVRSERALVIGSTTYSARLPSLAAQVEQARAEVADFWTAKWPARVVLVLPGRASLMDPLVGDESASRLPAVATWDPGPTGAVVRVTVNPEIFLSLPYVGQQIVLRHEITHLAQDALPAKNAPTWLSEGLAEYVGYRSTGFPSSLVAGAALARVRASGVPPSLPGDPAFGFGLEPAERTVVYEQGWTACKMIAERYGEGKLVPFYRAVVNGSGLTSDRIDVASRKVLGIDGDEFLEQWQSWLLDNA
jgi:hypothetical protein